MARKFSPEQEALYKLLDNILWSEWDPVGINSIAAARDEYHGYLFPLLTLLLQDAETSRLSSYLHHCETMDMGVEGCRVNCDKVAQLATYAKEKIFSYSNHSVN